MDKGCFIYDCRFCVGDRFYLCENKILCEYDYEARFANMAPQSPASLAYIKRQLPPTATPPGQNVHPGHNPLQGHQGIGQMVGPHNHATNVSLINDELKFPTKEGVRLIGKV